MSQPVHVVLCATDPISSAGVSAALRFRPELRLVSETDGGADGPAVALVVTDVVDDRVAQTLRRAGRDGYRLVLVATVLDDAAVFAAVEAGVSAVLRRAEATPDRLVSVVRSAAEGNGDVPSDLLGRLLDRVGNLQRQVVNPRGLSVTGLSDRETAVLRLVADGCDTSEIARNLSYSERTVKNVIHDVTTRLQLRNRSHAVAYAMRAGII